MGQIVITEENVSGALPALQVSIFAGTDGRVKTLDDSNVQNILTPLGWRDNNVIINGDFDFAQRQIPGTLTTYTNTTTRTYCADRWWLANENSGTQYQRVDSSSAPETSLQTRFYGKFKKLTAVGKFMVGQYIEANSMSHFRARQVRVQAKMKFSVAASMTVRLALVQLNSVGVTDTFPSPIVTAFGAASVDPTLGANVAYIAPTAGIVPENSTISGSGLNCVLTTGWLRFSGVFDVPASAKNLAVLVFTNGQVAINDELNIAEVGIYEGQETRDWFPRIANQRFAECQRYYCKTFGADISPGQNGGLGGALKGILGKAAATALAAQLQWRFPVPMRAMPPTVILYNPSAANAQMRQTSGTAADLTATVAANAHETGVEVTATGAAGGAIGDQVAIHISADAEL